MYFWSELLPVCPSALPGLRYPVQWPKTPLSQISERIFLFPPLFHFRSGNYFRSGFWFRLIGGTSAFRTCDRRTMDLVVFSRLTSAERVTSTGVGTSSRGAETKSDSLTGRLRPTLRSGFSVIYFHSQNDAVNRILSVITRATSCECNSHFYPPKLQI